MRKVREVLRLSAAGMSSLQVAASLIVGATTVIDYLGRARRPGIAWPLPDDLTDEALEASLYPPSPIIAKDQRPLPGWPMVHRELKRPGVTLHSLWEEYRGRQPQEYGYSRFCELYRAWAKRLSPTMRQTHVAGKWPFVDYAGSMLQVFDAATGEVLTAELFVAALGASRYTFAEATWTQTLGSHTRAYAFLGGVPAMMVSAICARHHQGLLLRVNCSYAEMAACWRRAGSSPSSGTASSSRSSS